MRTDTEFPVFPPAGNVIHLEPAKARRDAGATISPIDRPVFIVGSGRSGTTLLQRLLNSSPEFLIWGEHSGILTQIASAYEIAKVSYLADRLNFKPEDFPSREAALRNPDRWPGWDNALNRHTFDQLFHDFVVSLFTSPAREPVRWGFKEPRYGLGETIKTMSFLHRMFAGARTIILVRDPFSTVPSMVVSWYSNVQSKAEIDEWILKTATWWTEIYERLFLFHHEIPGASLIVKYEDVRSSACRERVESFLEANLSGDQWDRIAGVVKDHSDKESEFSQRVHGSLTEQWSAIAHLTSQVRALYKYPPEL